MLFRYFLALCVIVFGFIAVIVHAEEVLQIAGRAHPDANVVGWLYLSEYGNYPTGCIVEAAVDCKNHAKNPKLALECGKNYIAANTNLCAVRK